MKYSYFCKRCGEAKEFDTKEERNKFKDDHYPMVKIPVDPRRLFFKFVRQYACDMKATVTNGITVLRRRSAF